MHSSNMDLESCYLQWTDCHQAVVVAKGTMGGAISCIRHVVKTLIMGGSIRHVVMALWVECRSYQACSKGIMGRTTTSIRHVWGVHGGRQGDGYASCELPLVSGMCGVCMEGGRVMVMLAVSCH